MYKVGVIGGRCFNDQELMWPFLDTFEPFILVSGGANGADSLAERYANSRGYDKIIHHAEWDKHKPPEGSNRKNPAGMIRNRLIVRDADILIAYWDMKSPGTGGCIRLAQRRKPPMKSIYIINYISKEMTEKHYE